MTFEAWWQGRGKSFFAERLPRGSEVDALRPMAWAAFNAGEVEQAERAKGRIAQLTGERQRLRAALVRAAEAVRAFGRVATQQLSAEQAARCQEALQVIEQALAEPAADAA